MADSSGWKKRLMRMSRARLASEYESGFSFQKEANVSDKAAILRRPEHRFWGWRKGQLGRDNAAAGGPRRSAFSARYSLSPVLYF